MWRVGRGLVSASADTHGGEQSCVCVLFPRCIMGHGGETNRGGGEGVRGMLAGSTS